MRVGVVAVGLCLLLGSKMARAEGSARAPAEGVSVRISGVLRSVTLRIADEDTDRTVASCRGPCSFHAPAGHYTVYSRDDETGDRHELGLRVRHAGHFRFDAGDSTAKTTGLVIGIAGPTLIMTGFILIAPALLSNSCEDNECSSNGQRTASQIGLGALVLGAVATPIGWTMFASNRTRFVEMHAEDTSTPETFSLRLGLAGLAPGAFGVAGTGRF